jgi:hypothetical protein
MKNFSRRHNIVSKLVVTSIAVSSIFVINSVYFSFSKNKLSNSIKKFEALDALLTSTTTDQISTIANLKNSYSLCVNNFPIKCENYFTYLIQTRNRIKDYEITFSETLGLKKDDQLNDYLFKVYANTDNVAKKSFDMSFKEAKNQKISSSADYIKSIQNKNFSLRDFKLSDKNLTNSINSLYVEINNWVKEEINNSKTIPEIKRDVNIKYLILMCSNILLFFVVCSIDLMNNNAQPVKEGKV